MLPRMKMNPLYKLDLQAYYCCKNVKMLHAGRVE